MEDETALQMLYEDVVEYKTSSTEDDLTEEQWAEIDRGIKQIEKGETFTYEEVKSHFSEWLNK